MPVTVTTIYRDEAEVQAALGGENLRLRLTGIDEDDIASGFVICSRNAPVPCVTYFQAQLQVSLPVNRLCQMCGCYALKLDFAMLKLCTASLCSCP